MKNLKPRFFLVAGLFLSACSFFGTSSPDASSLESASQGSGSSATDSSSAASSSFPYPFVAGSSLIFNEFDGGSSASDRALELANVSKQSLSMDGYSVAIFKGNEATPSFTIPLSGELGAESVYVIASDSSSAALKSVANLVSEHLFNNGSYPMVLLKDKQRVDTLGYPGYQIAWGTKASLVRKREFQVGQEVYQPDDWIFYAADDFSHLGQFAAPLTDADMLLGPHLTDADFAAPYIGASSLGGGGVLSVTVRSYGDGDTTVFNLPSELSGYYGSFRYENVDTPETQHPTIDAQPWGYAAASFTNGLLRAATHILIQSVKGADLTETYGRLLGFVWITTVSSPSPSDYVQLNHQIVVNGYSRVAFSGITTSQMNYEGLSYFAYLLDANNHAAKLGLKVHGEKDPDFNY